MLGSVGYTTITALNASLREFLRSTAVIWVYLSEIFPTLVRAKGQSLGSSPTGS